MFRRPGHLFRGGPFGGAEGPAAAERAAHRHQLSFALTGTHFGSPSSATFRVGVSKFLPLGEGAQKCIVVSEAMAWIA